MDIPLSKTSELKVCRLCGKEKLLKDFPLKPNKYNPQYRDKRCKQCYKEYNRKYQGRYYTTERARAQRLWSKFRLRPDDWEKLFNSQNRECAICGVKEAKKFVVDHCHKSGKIRGILCSKCNTMIAFLGDNAESIENRIESIIRYVNT